jgi:hypothetical protein
MDVRTTSVSTIPVLTREEAMDIAATEYARTIAALRALSPDHDSRIVADAVADWARRHGHPFHLLLEGPAGGAFEKGHDGVELQLDAVEFCRVLSGRGDGEGLLTQEVPF